MFTSLVIIRYLIAYVFITSGLMKLLNEELGNYFISLGLPFPVILMYIVAALEVVCGVLILMNRVIKLATIPLIGIMLGAILVTKIPILHSSIISFAFNARLDIIMLVLLITLYSSATKQPY